jgi:hypothetical protein
MSATTVEPPAKLASSGAVPRKTTLGARVLLVIGIAAAVGLYSWAMEYSQPMAVRDLSQLVYGAQAYNAGYDPYAVVGRSERWQLPVPEFYPFTAILLFIPFAWIPAIVVNTAWVALGAGLLAWAVTREKLATPALVLFVSPPFLHAVLTTQWSPLLTASILLPWGGWLLACKPTTAIWLLAYRPTWRAIGLASGLTALSLLVWPTWPWAWLPNLREATYTVAPVTLPGGVLAVFALWKWRRPEARLLAVMALVPHTMLPYETLPLFLVPQTWREAWILLAGTMLAVVLHGAGEPYASPTAWATASGQWIIVCVYIPCLVMVLRRPNVGDVPLIDALLRRRPQ